MRPCCSWIGEFLWLPERVWRRELEKAPAQLRRGLLEHRFWQMHEGQEVPEGDWRVWLMMAGRGFGKTLAGADWVWEQARAHPNAQIALVGANLDEVAKVMVEGESGLQAAARTGEEVCWVASRQEATFSSGATGHAYSGGRPDKLRGPQHHFAWCDEIAKWAHGEESWHNLMLGLRLGERPRVMVSTTPRPVPVLKRILAMERLALSGGRTADNGHLPQDYIDNVTALFGGTRLGRQELEGLMIEEAAGALWTRAAIEKCRAPADLGRGFFRRVLVGVDPPASATGDACGIVVCGLGGDGVGYVLEDASLRGASPERWAAAVVGAAGRWEADRVVAEKNQGGDMVESVLRAADPDLPLRCVHAHKAKASRAEPVSTLFARGRAKFAGAFPELEDELCHLVPGEDYAGPGRSPDRADAMVWALDELMLRGRAEASVRAL